MRFSGNLGERAQTFLSSSWDLGCLWAHLQGSLSGVFCYFSHFSWGGLQRGDLHKQNRKILTSKFLLFLCWWTLACSWCQCQTPTWYLKVPASVEGFEFVSPQSWIFQLFLISLRSKSRQHSYFLSSVSGSAVWVFPRVLSGVSRSTPGRKSAGQKFDREEKWGTTRHTGSG